MTNKQNLNEENKTIGGINMKEMLSGKINGALINETQAGLIMEAIDFCANNKVEYNGKTFEISTKGNQFKEPKMVHEQTEILKTNRIVINAIPVVGITNLIYKHAAGLNLKPSVKMDKSILAISDIVTKVKEDDQLVVKAKSKQNAQAKVKIKSKAGNCDRYIDDYKDCFIAFEKYGVTVTGMESYIYVTQEQKDRIDEIEKEIKELEHTVTVEQTVLKAKLHVLENESKAIKKQGDKVLAVLFQYNNSKEFIIEFPFINKDLYFYRNGNKYAAMLTISNKLELLAKTTKELKLLHPYAWLSKKLIEAWSEADGTVKEYDKKVFYGIIERVKSKDKICHTFNRKLAKILNNIKKFSWQKEDNESPTPIIYVEKGNSSVGTYSFSKNILFDFTYNECVEIGNIPGVDFLTGSTSTPAKRCKIAYGWHVVGSGANIKLERKPGFSEGICDYVSELKISYPAFVKTSAKRDNCATAKDTVNFLPECRQTYSRKFISSIGQIADSTLNSIMKTMWVAKIDLYEQIEEELIDLGLFPNTNDCFLVSRKTLSNMTALFKKPEEDFLSYMTPGNGSKFIGSFRDKGSVTCVMDRYVPMVKYQCPDKESAQRLAIAVKEMKGENAKVKVVGVYVYFEIDIIANPSTGRDNVAALVLQSCMEQKAILEGKTYKVTPEEVASMNVEEIVEDGIYDHQVVLFDNIENKVVYDFGKTAVMLEDFFWQPKHDNQLHCKEADIALNYHQAIDGFKSMLPVLYKVMIKSIDFEALKENYTILGLRYTPIYNEVIKDEVIIKEDETEMLF